MQKSFVTTCGSIDDITRYGSSKWTKLVIQDDPCSPEIPYPQPRETLKPNTFEKTPHLEHLHVVQKINEIQPRAFNSLPILQYLQLYKNELKVLHKNTFVGFLDLRKLEATDNSIENISHGLLANTVVREIDFSNNKLTNLQVGQLNVPSLKKLMLRNNQISQLAVGCFHENLEYLNLDSNQLEIVDVMVFGLLYNLKTLILSNNKFQSIVNIPKMDSLEHLDLSHNQIHVVENQAFANLTELKYLSLGYNKISALVGSLFPENSRITNLHVHMNYLTNLVHDVTKNLAEVKLVSLGGNPWICECLLYIRNFLKVNKVRFEECDGKFFDSGSSPVCIAENRINCEVVKQEFLNEMFALSFRNSVKYECY